jgi:hypothetical protein
MDRFTDRLGLIVNSKEIGDSSNKNLLQILYCSVEVGMNQSK